MERGISIKDIIEKGESQIVEFKASLSLVKEGLESLCAMINADRAEGTVLFGVKDNGEISGIEPGNHDNSQRSLSQKITSKFSPPIIPEICVTAINEKNILMLKSRRLKGTPYHEFDGRAWIKQGTEKRQLTLDEKNKFSSARNRDLHNGPWKCDRCNSVAGILSSMVMTAQGPLKAYNCECGGEFWPV